MSLHKGSISKHRFNTQPPEGGWGGINSFSPIGAVSTHSRLKAAGVCFVCRCLTVEGFNTQPPEGGWKSH